MAARRLNIAYPIILVIGGLLLGFTSQFSNITIDPEMVFFIFLPPLLYEAAWQTSWKEFWRWRRVIMSFAFPIVIVTSCVVAYVSSALIPGFTLALGFLLGGIVSPPDAISATTIMRSINVPKSLVSIAEGESLLNDASSLIVFRFALAAIITGQFVFTQAATNFVLVIAMGTLIGLAIAMVFYAIHRWFPTTPSIDVVLSFITPYCMYYFAERLHFSGVLAVVAGGLLLSYKRHSMLTYLSRVQGANVWSTVGFVFNGLVFMLIGLQLPGIVRQLGQISLTAAIGYGLLIAVVLIITRLICTLGASVFTRIMGRFITVADPNPGWRSPLVLGWAGMRGVVSLAAALSIPEFIGEGVPFPQRNMILFVTFIVILVTLVLQGLTLPWLIRTVKPAGPQGTMPELQQEHIIRKKLAQAALNYLKEHYGDSISDNEHLSNMYDRFEIQFKHFTNALEREADDGKPDLLYEHQFIALNLVDEQRKLLKKMNERSEFDEDIIRKYMSLLDLEETKLREKLLQQ